MWNEEHAFEISSEKEAVVEILDKENVGEDKFMGELKAREIPLHLHPMTFGSCCTSLVEPQG